jgi:hypothetical protein
VASEAVDGWCSSTRDIEGLGFQNGDLADLVTHWAPRA